METWTYNNPDQTKATAATVTGRTTISWQKKINPVWFVQNSAEQTVLEAPWYHGPDTSIEGYMGPAWPYWRRWLYWNVFRNPLRNFIDFVIGVQDCNYTVTGKAPIDTIQRDDIGQLGWQWSVIHLAIPLPFVSYSGKTSVWYIGWAYGGGFGLKLNRRALVWVFGLITIIAAAIYFRAQI